MQTHYKNYPLIPLSKVKVGDRLIIRNGDLIFDVISIDCDGIVIFQNVVDKRRHFNRINDKWCCDLFLVKRKKDEYYELALEFITI